MVFFSLKRPVTNSCNFNFSSTVKILWPGDLWPCATGHVGVVLWCVIGSLHRMPICVIDRILYAVPVTDFLPGLSTLCSLTCLLSKLDEVYIFSLKTPLEYFWNGLQDVELQGLCWVAGMSISAFSSEISVLALSLKILNIWICFPASQSISICCLVQVINVCDFVQMFDRMILCNW